MRLRNWWLPGRFYCRQAAHGRLYCRQGCSQSAILPTGCSRSAILPTGLFTVGYTADRAAHRAVLPTGLFTKLLLGQTQTLLRLQLTLCWNNTSVILRVTTAVGGACSSPTWMKGHCTAQFLWCHYWTDWVHRLYRQFGKNC